MDNPSNQYDTTAMLGLLIAKIKRKMRKRMNDKLKPYEITAEQRTILLVLYNEGEMTQAELCDFTSTEPSNLSITLKRLIKKNYIVRVNHPKDPRAYLIQTTNQTHAIVDELLLLSSLTDNVLFKGIDKKALKITFETLKKMDINLK